MRVRLILAGLVALFLPTASLAGDRDNDLLDDDDELALGTDPDSPDTDGGGRLDGYEVHIDGTDPLDFTDDREDTDGDGLSDIDEDTVGTDPEDPDSDGDRLSDGDEVILHDTDPTDPDTDDDGLGDCLELFDLHTEPAEGDSDGDGIPDSQELADATDPIGTTSWCDSAPVIATDAITVTCVADGTYAVQVQASDTHSYVTTIYAHPAFPEGEAYSSVAVLDKQTEARLAAEYRFGGEVDLPGATCEDLVVIRFTAVNARGNTARAAWWSGDPPPSPCSGDRFSGTIDIDSRSHLISGVGDAYYSSLSTLGDTDGDGLAEVVVSDGETTHVLSNIPGIAGDRSAGAAAAVHTFSGQSCATVGAIAGSGGVQLLTGDWCYADFEGQVDVRDPVSGAVTASYQGVYGGGLDMFGQALPALTDVGPRLLTSDFMGEDGVADLVVGGSRYNDWDGRAWIFAGPLAGGTPDTADVSLDSGTDGGYSELGNNVESGGDLNGDGVDDLIFSRTFFSNSYRPADVLVLDGPIAAGDYQARDLAIGRVYVDQSISFTATRPGGDLDNDGYGDLLVSDHTFSDADDRVSVFLGPIANDMELNAAAMSVRGDGIGFLPSYGVGDLDGDNLPDLLVGRSDATTAGGDYAGEAGLLYGPIPTGTVSIADMDAHFQGSHAYGSAGQGVLITGDLVGDGMANLLLTVDDGFAMPLPE